MASVDLSSAGAVCGHDRTLQATKDLDSPDQPIEGDLWEVGASLEFVGARNNGQNRSLINLLFILGGLNNQVKSKILNQIDQELPEIHLAIRQLLNQIQAGIRIELHSSLR